MNELLLLIKEKLKYRFSLHDDQDSEDEIIASIYRKVEFKGVNLWTLMFAILIASIGLNVNSTAVIIGAMLISPLMGPIMGVGMGIAINDFQLLKKSLRNLFIASVIGIIVSTAYFLITPLTTAQSELIARTTPSLWDVFIAFFGGLAGIVASTRKEKGTAIPGVAIATALMPPLCTAGYGIANGNVYYFLGAIYLYFINSVFICLSTFLIVRYMRFSKKQLTDTVRQKKVTRYIWIIVFITTLPSIYLAYRIVDRSIFETNAQRFIKEQFNFANTQVVNKSIKYTSQGNEIDLLLIGNILSQDRIDSLKKSMASYSLANSKLIIHQGLNAKREIDLSQIKASILEEEFKNDSLSRTSAAQNGSELPDIGPELKTLYPEISAFTINNVVVTNIGSARNDTVTLMVADLNRKMQNTDQRKLKAWLKTRLNADSVRVLVSLN